MKNQILKTNRKLQLFLIILALIYRMFIFGVIQEPLIRSAIGIFLIFTTDFNTHSDEFDALIKDGGIWTDESGDYRIIFDPEKPNYATIENISTKKKYAIFTDLHALVFSELDESSETGYSSYYSMRSSWKYNERKETFTISVDFIYDDEALDFFTIKESDLTKVYNRESDPNAYFYDVKRTSITFYKSE